MEEPTDPNQLKADMQKCPRWILAKLQSERKARSELEAQLKQLLPEVDKYNSELEAYKAKLVLLEAELNQKNVSENITDNTLTVQEQIEQIEAQIKNKQKLLLRKNDELQNYKKTIKELQDQNAVTTAQVKEQLEKKEQIIKSKQEEIDRIKTEISRYANFLKTRVSIAM